MGFSTASSFTCAVTSTGECSVTTCRQSCASSFLFILATRERTKLSLFRFVCHWKKVSARTLECVFFTVSCCFREIHHLLFVLRLLILCWERRGRRTGQFASHPKPPSTTNSADACFSLGLQKPGRGRGWAHTVSTAPCCESEVDHARPRTALDETVRPPTQLHVRPTRTGDGKTRRNGERVHPSGHTDTE